MCGIGGLSAGNFSSLEVRDTYCARILAALEHRGPDCSGIWHAPGGSFTLLHRRLSIIDLSPSGHQPMVSPSGRYAITFNGEIYNFTLLRKELEMGGTVFSGHSDTEVLLAGFDRWGVLATLPRLVGMFAFGVWDIAEEVLWLARDRFGEKPLCYGWIDGGFVFASEVRAIRRAFPALSTSAEMVDLFMCHGYMPSPYTIYQELRKVPPGHYLKVTARELRQGGSEAQKYYNVTDRIASGVRASKPGVKQDLVEQLDFLLKRTIRGQMVSDVPLGAFLSGGIDSSLVVATMQKLHFQPVRTFSIGFREVEFDESGYAREVAKILGTQHTELVVTAREAMNVVPLLPRIYDEPFADSSQIPTYLVSQLARSAVTVSLSGDGGDELFGGYSRYELSRKLWSSFRHFPLPLRRVAAGLLNGLSRGGLASMLSLLERCLRTKVSGNTCSRLRRLATLLNAKDRRVLYRGLMSHWAWPDECVNFEGQREIGFGETLQLQFDEFLEEMMLSDLSGYLPDDILVKVDRASMAVSLETRVPFLDHRVVEFALGLPSHLRSQPGKSKWILREILRGDFPESLFDRRKHGFNVPVGEWIRGPMRDWAEALLSSSALRRSGFLRPEPIRKRWQEHLTGSYDWHSSLWTVLMFQAWMESNQS